MASVKCSALCYVRLTSRARAGVATSMLVLFSLSSTFIGNYHGICSIDLRLHDTLLFVHIHGDCDGTVHGQSQTLSTNVCHSSFFSQNHASGQF